MIAVTVVSKPLVPPLVHDDGTRVAVGLVCLLFCAFVIYRAMRYFNSP